MLSFIPYKKLIYESDLSVEDILSNINEVLIFTKTKTIFTASSSDFLYLGKTNQKTFSLKRKTF